MLVVKTRRSAVASRPRDAPEPDPPFACRASGVCANSARDVAGESKVPMPSLAATVLLFHSRDKRGLSPWAVLVGVYEWAWA